MGMYTGLRGKVLLKGGYVAKVQEQLNSSRGFIWEEILPESNGYNNYSRNSFIPQGTVCYMPDEWGNGYSKLDGNVFEFCCSLKNYESTIEVFIEECLPEIALSWELEELYESDYEPIYHTKQV